MIHHTQHQEARGEIGTQKIHLPFGGGHPFANDRFDEDARCLRLDRSCRGLSEVRRVIISRRRAISDAIIRTFTRLRLSSVEGGGDNCGEPGSTEVDYFKSYLIPGRNLVKII